MNHPLYPHLVGRHQPLDIDLVGAGGNGSQMLTGLARLHVALQGVGHPGLNVTAYDPDTVTHANIGRQLFSPSDVGQHKVSVLIHRLNCFFGLNWRAVPKLYERHGQQPAFLIGCVDSIASRRILARQRCYYWLDLGNRDRTGQVVLGRSKHATDEDTARPRTFFELFPELLRGKTKEDNAPSCSLAAALERQDLFINQTVTTWALHLLWSFIRNGQTAVQGYYINLETGRTVPIPITAPPSADPPTKPKSAQPALNKRRNHKRPRRH